MFFRLVTAVLLVMSSLPAWAEVPKRIVSLKPSITDTIYALGIGDRLVGVTKYCEVPEGKPHPKIAADYTRPYTERVIALMPDVVLGSEENSSRRSIEALRRAGIRVELFPFTTLAETLGSIEQMAELFGVHERGKRLRLEMKAALEGLRRRGEHRRAVVVWGLRPMVIAGPGGYMDEAMEYIGLENAVGSVNVRYPKIGLEQLIGLDPDVIVDLSMDVGDGATSERPWDGITVIKAVREGRVVSMEPAAFRAGPNLPKGLRRLAKGIYGD